VENKEMPSSSAYLFLELAILVYVMGFGWEYWNTTQLRSRSFLVAAAVLAAVWFVLDQIAVHLGLWTFPENGTVRVRLLALPIEEYLLFLLHTVICFVLIKQCSGNDE
jgi:lycopene cyclase domain-containing protein